MRWFGDRHCHLLVAHAWLGQRPEGKVCDHLDGNLLNWCADNLRWITPEQNIAWAKRQRAMRKTGLSLSHISSTLLLRISDLSDLQFETFLAMVKEVFASDTRQLTIDNINFDIAHTLDWIDSHTVQCSRCGREMIEDIDVHHTNDYGILCDCCYDDMFN